MCGVSLGNGTLLLMTALTSLHEVLQQVIVLDMLQHISPRVTNINTIYKSLGTF